MSTFSAWEKVVHYYYPLLLGKFNCDCSQSHQPPSFEFGICFVKQWNNPPRGGHGAVTWKLAKRDGKKLDDDAQTQSTYVFSTLLSACVQMWHRRRRFLNNSNSSGNWSAVSSTLLGKDLYTWFFGTVKFNSLSLALRSDTIYSPR